MAVGVGLNKDNGTVSSQIHYHPHSLLGLPEDMQLAILSLLPLQGEGGLAALSSVSHYFEVLASDNGLWKLLFREHFPYLNPQFPESCKALFKENSAVAVRMGQCHTITLENQENVTCAKIRGEFICTGSKDGTIVVLDRTTGKTLCTIDSEIGHVLCIDMPMKSSILCAVGQRGVQAWTVDTQKGLFDSAFRDINQQDKPMRGWVEGWIKIYEDRWLCAARFCEELCIWDLVTQKRVPIDSELSGPNCVRFFKDEVVCTAQGNTKVVLGNLKTGRILRQYNFKDDDPLYMKICNNKCLFVASGAIFVKDILTGNSLLSIKRPPFPADYSCMDIKEDTLCIGWAGGWLSVHNLKTGALLYVFFKSGNILEDVLNGTAGHDYLLYWRRVKMIHNTILVSQSTQSICFWDLATGQQLHEKCMLANDDIELFDIQGNTFLTTKRLGSEMMISRFK
jgi:WD40 repeat protein